MFYTGGFISPHNGSKVKCYILNFVNSKHAVSPFVNHDISVAVSTADIYYKVTS